MNFLARRKPRTDLYFADREMRGPDWVRLALGLLIPLSLIAMAAAIDLGVFLP